MDKREYNIVFTDWGIGDAICALYAIQGLRIAEPESIINFYANRNFEWLELADIDAFYPKKYRPEVLLPDPIILSDYSIQDKHLNSPKHLFSSKLGVIPEVPLIKGKYLNVLPVVSGEYIVVSPFSAQANRTWNIKHWKVLIESLKVSGYRVIISDGPFQEKRCKELDTEYFCGKSAAWTMNLCRHASLIIGNDSGIAHVGGWVGTRTIVIMSQLLPEQFYSMTNNRFIIPNQRCTGCRFQKEFGYMPVCNNGCWVLQSANPIDVFNATLSWLNEEQQSVAPNPSAVNTFI